MPDGNSAWYVGFLSAFSIWVAQNAATGLVKAHYGVRQQLLDLENLLSEIEIEQQFDEKNTEIFRSALENGLFEQRIKEDPNYAPYIVAGDKGTSVFGPDATTRFSHTSAETLSAVRKLKDMQSALRNQLTDFRSQTFIALSAERKMVVFSNIVEKQNDVARQAEIAISLIKHEIARHQRRLSWYLTFAWVKGPRVEAVSTSQTPRIEKPKDSS